MNHNWQENENRIVDWRVRESAIEWGRTFSRGTWKKNSESKTKHLTPSLYQLFMEITEREVKSKRQKGIFYPIQKTNEVSYLQQSMFRKLINNSS